MNEMNNGFDSRTGNAGCGLVVVSVVGENHFDCFKDKMKLKAFIWVHGLVFNQQ